MFDAFLHLDKSFHNEGLEEFKRHFLRKTALVNFQLRTYDYNGTSGIVDTFSEKVLTERPCFPFSMSERDLSGLFDGPVTFFTVLTVVEQGIDRLLQHSLLILDYYGRGAEFKQSFQTVVSVYHTSVKVIDIR